MFNQNNEEKKLDWMYKGPNSNVDREEYLLGRSVDKTLEQLNEEEKQKLQGITVPKNRVEHECIPPSIRDFNKIVQAEQVDLSAKLQEDPLVAIKKREEETRREFLQNPVQLKKLQKALKAQQMKKNKKKRKKSKSLDTDSDSKLSDKLKLLTGDLLGKKKRKRVDKEESDLDTILIHKFNELKSKLSQADLQNILAGNISDSDESDSDGKKAKKKSRDKKRSSSADNDSSDSDDVQRRKFKNRPQKQENRKTMTYNNSNGKETSEQKHRRYTPKYGSDEKETSEQIQSRARDYSEGYRKRRNDIERNRSRSPRNRSRSPRNRSRSPRNRSRSPHHKCKKEDDKRRKRRSDSSSDSDEVHKSHKRSERRDSDSDSPRPRKQNWGLVKSDGSKIALNHRSSSSTTSNKAKTEKKVDALKPVERQKGKRLTEEEKEKLRQEMMKNAKWRDTERTYNVKKYRESDEKESKKQRDFEPDFVHKQLLKSANSSSVESRIKANLSKIQRSSRDMDRNFSRR